MLCSWARHGFLVNGGGGGGGGRAPSVRAAPIYFSRGFLFTRAKD